MELVITPFLSLKKLIRLPVLSTTELYRQCLNKNLEIVLFRSSFAVKTILILLIVYKQLIAYRLKTTCFDYTIDLRKVQITQKTIAIWYFLNVIKSVKKLNVILKFNVIIKKISTNYFLSIKLWYNTLRKNKRGIVF